MDGLLLLAQQQPAAPAARRLLERFFSDYPPLVTVPIFLVGLVLATVLVERVVLAFVRRMTARTTTKVDDALAEGLPLVLRPLVVIVALHVIVHQLLRDPADVSKLSPEGELANKGLSFLSVIVIAFCATIVGLRMIDAWIDASEHRKPVGPAIKLGIKVLMVPLAILAALQAVDVNISAFLTALGVGSLAIGLALQDTLKNMFAGIQLVLDRPIRAGDFVEIEKGLRGTVLEIGMRSTRLRSAENNVVIIPNSTIANAAITNLDFADRSYVETFNVSVAYGTDTRRAQALLEKTALDAAKDLAALAEDPPRVVLRELGDSGVQFQVHVRFRQWAGRQPLVSELYHRFYEALRKEGIEIPYPTRTIHLKRDDVEVSAS